ncbi:amino acid ABC transporter substrate-binding protein, PAAT family [Thalassoporum mexicanum PCC 7367]|uniref:substrate-binding periplasmic protein n=1 Tax=Thalassoporum mexicanum TaxID=3457544 RepID=UPI00029FE0A0|nr:ABC transporter substrate-binding protein [Pseudanabaena sp. PCC 7367]AFY71875.1 amino acid ABC transporter substrate-binding protein, PAAT family [Pseudanabaena sp. PCC 7367]
MHLKGSGLLKILAPFGLGLGILIGSASMGAMPVYADGSLATVSRRGNLRVGIDASIGGAYMFWNPKTQYYDGFEWEIIEAIAAKLDVAPRPINIPWASQTNSLLMGDVDLILSVRETGGLESDPNQDEFAESIPYYQTSQRLLVHKDTTNVNSLRDLIGKRVGVIANSGGAAIVETYNNNRGNAVRLFASRDLDRMIAQLRAGQLDAMLLDEPIAVWQVREDPNLQISGDRFLPINLVVIVRQGDETLKAALDRAIIELQQEGKLESILRRWKLWYNSREFLQSTEASPNITLRITMQFWDYH